MVRSSHGGLVTGETDRARREPTLSPDGEASPPVAAPIHAFGHAR